MGETYFEPMCKLLIVIYFLLVSYFGYMTCGWMGSTALFSGKCPLLNIKTWLRAHFYDEFGGKLHIF